MNDAAAHADVLAPGAPDPGPRVVLAVDWNGTIVDDDTRVLEASRTALARQGLTAHQLDDLSTFRAAFTLPVERFCSEVGVPTSAVPAVVGDWNRLIVEMPPPATVTGAESLLLCAGALDIDVHVVSGADAAVAHTDLQRLKLGHLVKTVTGRAHPKRAVISGLRPHPQVAVFIGDTVYDVEEGLAAGAVTVGVAADDAKRSFLTSAGAHLLVEDLREVVPLLHALQGTEGTR